MGFKNNTGKNILIDNFYTGSMVDRRNLFR